MTISVVCLKIDSDSIRMVEIEHKDVFFSSSCAVRPAPNTNFSRMMIMDKEKTSIPVKFLFEGQFQHILLLTCLVPGAIYLELPALDGSLWL